MFTVLPYNVATGGSVTDLDMNATTDPDFSQRNSHYIFTEPYKLICAAGLGANLTRINFQPPTWNAVGRHNLWPFNKSANVPSPPQVMWSVAAPLPVPLNEEFQIKVTDAASETPDVLIWLATSDWNQNIPHGILPICVRVTATITGVAHGYSTASALTFEQSLRGGVYAVVGASWQATNAVMFRLIFPRQPLYHGRKLRPGWLAQNAIGDLEEPRVQIHPPFFGEWGRFHTFEPPQIEIYSNTAGSQAGEGRLWLVYMTDTGGALAGGGLSSAQQSGYALGA